MRDIRRTTQVVLGTLAAILVDASLLANEAPPTSDLVFIATYSPHDGEGIFVGSFDPKTEAIAGLRSTGGLRSPAALALHPHQKILYATTLMQDDDQKSTGAVAALSIGPGGDLKEIDRRPSGGMGPCYLAVTSAGDCLLAANCSTASVACFGLLPDGRFSDASTIVPHEGVSRNSEGKPQAHSILPTENGRFAMAADLGLDCLFAYHLNATQARLLPLDSSTCRLAAGSGPRHLAFHPRGPFLYVVNELDNTVGCCKISADTGALEYFHAVSTLPADYRGESYAAHVAIHPSGRFLYASNRGHDSLAIFAIDPDSGKLRQVEISVSGGKFPRHFSITSNGRHLIVANQKSDLLTVFKVDVETGQLNPQTRSTAISAPVCVKIR